MLHNSSESLVEAILEATDNGILIVNTNRKVVKCNSRFLKMWTIPFELQNSDQDEELLYFASEQLENPQQFINKIIELYQQPEAESFDTINFKDGKIFERFSRPVHLNDEVVARVWSFRDVTATETIKNELAIEAGFRKSIIRSLPDLVWLKDPDGVYLACNHRFENFFGASETEIIGKTDYDFINAEQADSFRAHDIKAMKEGSSSINNEWVTFANNGHQEFLETIKKPMYNEQNDLIGVLGISRDITKSDKKMRESAQILQSIVETTLDGFWTVDYQGNLLDVNSEYCHQSGYTREELLTMQISELDATMSAVEIEERMKIILNQKRIQFETKHRRKDGSIWDIEISITYFDILGGRFFAFMRDITERKKMEDTLQKSEKILIINSRQAAMGEMISMIAHQWRQPLNIIGLAIANVQTKEALNILTKSELDEIFNIVSSNITYMSGTIDDFRNYLNPNQEKESVVMENILNIVLGMVGKSFEHSNITLNIKNNSRLSLLLYKNKLIQVLLNLLDNAKYALISNKVSNPCVFLSVHETVDTIRIEVCDNGGGISQEALEHLGEPYFTTKALIGTGLGLHIAKTIMQNYFGGTLTWHNENNGACFTLIAKRDSWVQFH